MQINNSTAFITGASRGIGLAVSRELINAGAKVFLTSRSEHELSVVCKKLDPNGDKAFYAVMDVTGSASVKIAISRALEVFGKIDILINNAGITSQQMVHMHDFSSAEKEIQINYLGTFLVSQTLLPVRLNAKEE
ncbi:MAG: SDR family NAD(P)-dependent oxidoreductase [Bacteroidota bacterium]|nr:SDR family NAD(P)-dependent oxidoreductase [Bacteroidota bacterium]